MRKSSIKRGIILLALCGIGLLLGMCVSCGGSGAESPAVSDTSRQEAAVSSEMPEEVSLSDVSLEIGKGITRQITATGGKQIRWRSSDTTVATVDDSGNVKGVAPGECVLTAENEYGSSARCAVAVKKTCYLSFDDGPTGYVEFILDVLKENDVKATFFVCNTTQTHFFKRMHEEGHCIGLHAGWHVFSHCYRSEYGYFCDLDELNDVVEQYTGTRSNMLRFPGGTNNTVSDPLLMRRMVNGANDLGYRVFDWTTSAGDSRAGASSDSSFANVVFGCHRDEEIVLMHDKAMTISAVKRLIPALREKGYVFETLDHYPEQSMMEPCRYTWNNPDVPSTAVALNREELTLAAGESFQLTAQMTPERSTDFVRWESADSAVAMVDASGRVKGAAAGETTVTAITTAGQRAVCRITVA